MVRTREACYGKLLATDVRPSGRSSHPVRTMFLYKQDFSAKISENPVAQLSVRTAMVHHPDDPRHILPDAHSDPQPINRGPWALRAARIRCEFH
jgi:hypothetical protein